jgi:hypothetical protein
MNEMPIKHSIINKTSIQDMLWRFLIRFVVSQLHDLRALARRLWFREVKIIWMFKLLSMLPQNQEVKQVQNTQEHHTLPATYVRTTSWEHGPFTPSTLLPLYGLELCSSPPILADIPDQLCNSLLHVLGMLEPGDQSDGTSVSVQTVTPRVLVTK